jgi:hypothetical protein
VAVITLRNGTLFEHINNFILRELLDLMRDELLPDDGEGLHEVDQAEWVTALMLDTYEPAIADRLEQVLLRVAHAVVDGRLPLRSPRLQDPENREMFVGSMRKLLKLMVHPVEGGPPSSE